VFGFYIIQENCSKRLSQKHCDHFLLFLVLLGVMVAFCSIEEDDALLRITSRISTFFCEIAELGTYRAVRLDYLLGPIDVSDFVT